MPPTPQEPVSTVQISTRLDRTNEPQLHDDSIVISGMSGMFPNANNIKEFSDVLYNKENPVSHPGSRWDLKHPELSEYVGKAPHLDRFDAQFFSVPYRFGNHMDPMSRKLLEHTFQAIYDAGMSPAQFNGKKVAVFVGSSFSDTEKEGFLNSKSQDGYAIIGSNKAMHANRISFWLNSKGPSLCMDEADCSSTTALQEACFAIQRGECEAAIVGGAHLCLHPHTIIHNGRLAMISKDGKTKSYSDNASGYVLSDAVGVILLQRAKDALRNYAEVIHVKSEYASLTKDKMGQNFGYHRDIETAAKFIRDFYDEAQVPPQAVEYVEGYGTGVPCADKSELEAFAEVYCKDRMDPLLVGSVTSNIGLTEASSGIVAIIKVLLGYHKGKLAANLNCDQPQRGVLALRNGSMRIVTDHQQFRRTYAAINGMSAMGVNSHVLLCGHYKPKDLSRYSTSIPYLVTLSGRQEDNIRNVIANLKSRPIDAEEIALLHNIHSTDISGHLGRGFIILDTNPETQNTITLVENANYFNNARPPLWFVYSGMGSQWAGMGAQLMRIPIFASAIERCQQVLAPKGLDIVNIICSPDKTIFDNILHSFVGIAAVQIGLTDILRDLGLVPDGIIGHSVGELGCAYADGSMSAEEMILAAYSRGQVSLETTLIRGSMAAIGLGYNQVRTMCPPEVDVACHNSSTSCTISGPADVMRDFVAELSAQGIFAKEVPCSNIAYHSRYIADAGPKLLKYLKEVIKNPRTRSERWISTSVPRDKWNEPSAKYCSAEYHTNNLLNPVLFEETCRLIPHNAVLVEVAPHGLLQAILKRSMPIDCRNIPLTRRGHPDNVVQLLQAIGNIYMEGYALNLQVLYPKIQFPVSTETPMLSHLVEWMHSEKWNVTSFNVQNRKTAPICNFVMSIQDNEHKYLKGHVITKKMCYPYAASLVTVWDMFAMHAHVSKRKVSISFQDVRLHAQPLLFDQKPLRLSVSLHSGTGRFEVMTEHFTVITGFIIKRKSSNLNVLRKDVVDKNHMELTSKCIYQLLNDRGYNYTGDFQSIECACASLNKASLVWSDNWVTFIDGMIQLNMLRQTHSAVSLPIYIKSISIDVGEHFDKHVYYLNGRSVMEAEVSHNVTRCGGVVLENIRYRNLPPMNRNLKKVELTVTPSKVGNLYETKSQQNVTTKIMTLQSGEIGKLDSLHWVQSPYVQKSKVIVTVHFAGLNLFDVSKATGVASYISNTYGMSYSGVTKDGERVMGLLSEGAASSQVDAQLELMWPVPQHWSLEDAATVPFAYAYAFYALVIKGHIEPGMNILIHDGTSALGQAAIAIAFAYKCRVFTTVTSIKQKMFLQKLFPLLQDEHFGNLCNISFSDNVLLVTGGRGCDIIIGCIKGYLKDVSMKCCSFSGILIDTIQIQDQEDYEYGMNHMTKSRSYLILNFSSIFTHKEHGDIDVLHKLLSDGITYGYVVPLTRVTYAPCDVIQAFKLLQKGQHPVQVLLNMLNNRIQVEHRIICDPNQCQIIFWNNDTFGTQLAERLISQGAKILYISCTNSSDYLQFKIRSWEKLGLKVKVSTKVLTKDIFRTEVLNDALNLGTIESIYVVLTTPTNNESTRDYASGLDKLDSVSRLLCHQLKNFVVVSTVKALGENVCLSRVKSELPATWLDLSNCNMKALSGPDMVDAVERALCSENVTFVTQTKQLERVTLLDQIVTLADIKIPQHVGMDVSLRQLGLGDEKIPSICAFLNITYNLPMEDCQVPKLTLQRIQELEEYVTEITPKNVRGLSTFISSAYCDELLATLDLVVLPTLSHKVSLENYFDIAGQYLCIIPGIEGHHERFHLICERLKLPAVVLQPGLDHPHETAKETAQRYAEVLFKKTKLEDKFYILGYESGAMVALELAAILEDQGSTGTVFCLGCAPSEFQAQVQYELSEFETEEQLEDAVIEHVCRLLSADGAEEVGVRLRGATSWAQKVDASIRCLMGRMERSVQFARALLEVSLARLVRARRFEDPVPRALRSQIVMLRAATAAPHLLALHHLSLQPVAIHQLQSPLSCITTDMQCAALINQYFDDHIQKQFDSKNLCETYVIQN